jgi:hypothetical protein
MFLTMLGGSLALGAGLLAAASYGEGTLLALRTAAQIIGWLFLLCTVVGLEVLRRGHPGGIAAAALTLACGLGLLYMSYFQWEGVHDLRRAVAESPPVSDLDYKRIDPAVLAPTATLASMAVPAPAQPVQQARAADACASLTDLESLQCRRCGGKAGIAWIACQESARLEFCEGRPVDEATCPSPIPYSHPG